MSSNGKIRAIFSGGLAKNFTCELATLITWHVSRKPLKHCGEYFVPRTGIQKKYAVEVKELEEKCTKGVFRPTFIGNLKKACNGKKICLFCFQMCQSLG